MSALPLLLITRPLPQARRFAAEAAAACPPHEARLAPLSRIEALPYDAAILEGARALVLTSANALPFLPPLPALPAWCVGPATAAAAQAAGFTPLDGGGDAAALVARLQAARPPGPLVHAHGLPLSRDLAAALPQLDLRKVAVYEARALDFPPEVTALMTSGRRIVAPLFSPRAARLLARQPGILAAEALLPVAISPNCAAALPPALAARALIAETPDGGGMLRAVSQALTLSGPAP